MRNAFAEELIKLATLDERIVLLSGDIGNLLFDPFKKKFPNRFYNCGVAEANMTGIAAGLASCRFRPITYTITPFNTTRCLEQIRNDLCYHNLPVIVVGVGSGLSYGSLGGSHHSCEDISFLRTLPNMKVVCPADAYEVRQLLSEALKQKTPVFLRLGKKGEPLVYKKKPNSLIGKINILKKGQDVTIIATGNMVFSALEIANILENKNVSVQVANMHTIKPLDHTQLKDIFTNSPLVVSLEEHSLIGGLGSALAEWLVDHNISTKLLRFGTPDAFPSFLGSQTFLKDHFGLSIKKISQKIWDQICILEKAPL